MSPFPFLLRVMTRSRADHEAILSALPGLISEPVGEHSSGLFVRTDSPQAVADVLAPRDDVYAVWDGHTRLTASRAAVAA